MYEEYWNQMNDYAYEQALEEHWNDDSFTEDSSDENWPEDLWTK